MLPAPQLPRLKAGFYSPPGPRNCSGYAGSWQHEALDASRFADWGFDFLKYDWRSYGEVIKGAKSLDAFKKPYRLMGDIRLFRKCAEPGYASTLSPHSKRTIFLHVALAPYGISPILQWGYEPT